ncbi:hypothetical protein PM082_005122 [Marasmius tenuissimus]|nr:hypothetical protein PM082_005122 [Marasmius tenuissimus]
MPLTTYSSRVAISLRAGNYLQKAGRKLLTNTENRIDEHKFRRERSLYSSLKVFALSIPASLFSKILVALHFGFMAQHDSTRETNTVASGSTQFKQVPEVNAMACG